MPNREDTAADRRAIPLLSTVEPVPAQQRAVVGLLLGGFAIFLAVAPFASLELPAVPAFVSIQQAAYAVVSLATALLLLGQIHMLRSRALALLAGAYLFDAAMAVIYGASLPGLFSPGGLPGAGPQTAAWLYLLWHVGFPLLVTAYATLRGRRGDEIASSRAIWTATSAIAAAMLALAALLAAVATLGHAELPDIAAAGRYVPRKAGAAAAIGLLSAGALFALWRRRPRSILDLWLMLALSAGVFDSALSSALSEARFDLGWYAGRIYDLVAGSLLFMVLLVEHNALYEKLARTAEADRRRSRERLWESEAHFHALFDGIAEAVVLADSDCRIRLVNPAFVRTFGYSAGEVADRSDEFLFAGDASRGRRLLHVASDATPRRFEVQLRRKNGTEFWAESSIARIHFADGALLGFMSIHRDISERRQAELALARSEATYRAVVETSMDGFWMVGPKQRLLAVNDAYVRRSGYSRAELLAMRVPDLEAIEDEATVVAHEARIRANGSDLFETLHRTRDGSTWPVEVMVSQWPEADNQLFVFLRDISDRKRTLDALRESERLYRLTFAQAAIGIAHVALDGRWLRVNAKLCDILGYADDELRTMRFQDVTHPDDQEVSRHHLTLLTAGNVQTSVYEKRYLRKDGRIVWAKLTAATVPHADGSPDHFVTVIEDITERKKTEEELRRLRDEVEHLVKFQVASQTASALAHELNQPLNAVAAYASAALRMLAAERWNPEKLRYALAASEQQAQRAGQVVRDLLAFLNKGRVEAESLDLNDLIRETTSRIRANNLGGVQLRLELAPELQPVRANRVQVQKVLINLVENGVEAMHQAGVSEAAIAVTVRSVDDGSMAQVSVSDNGPGVDPEILSRIFEPFFTTKSRGLGMGLAISRAIIEANGGRLWVDSLPGAGAVFHFTLPFAPVAATVEA